MPVKTLTHWALIGFWSAGVFSVTAQEVGAEKRFTYEKAEMGVPFRVTLYATDETDAQKAAEAAFARVSELNAVLSDYDPESELCRLSYSSGKGTPIPVSKDLWNVISFAQEMSERSKGTFDMTVGPVVQIWRTARRKKELPDPEKVTSALTRVGYRFVKLNKEKQTVELQQPVMRLDAGGIAKGYAIEEALNLLKSSGFDRVMMSGGGDVGVGEPPPGQDGWRIEVPSLDLKDAPKSRFLTLKNAFVSTSGDTYQYLEKDGKRYSHVIDPRTGMALTNRSLVTVVGLHGMETETLSKVLSVGDLNEGMAIVKEKAGAAAHVVRVTDGKIEEKVSPSWKQYEE